VTGLYAPLMRRLRLLVACLMLATAFVPPSADLARGVSAQSVGAAAARAPNSKSTVRVGFRERVTPRVVEAFSRAAVPSTPALAATAQEPDGRYLYLELVTLLS
jgi:hypothetical protein